MKAAVLHGIHDLRFEEVSDPKPLRDEVLIRITAAGVCGTDVHMWEGINFEGTFPFIPGHEWCGEVVELGPETRSLRVGDRVTGECFIPCRTCAVCKDGGVRAFCLDNHYYGFRPNDAGGMAEYHVSPEERLHKIPDNMTDEEAAMVEPVSVAYHAIWGRGGGVAPHDRVGVFGTGPIGLFAIQTAKASGAQVIAVEPHEYRANKAKEVGADIVVDPTDQEEANTRIMDLTDGLGLTLIVECSGSVAGIANTVHVIGVDGRIVLTGQSMGVKTPIELGKTIWKHASIAGSCGSPYFFPKTITYMSRGISDVKQVITHRMKFSEVKKAFELGVKASESGKIILTP